MSTLSPLHGMEGRIPLWPLASELECGYEEVACSRNVTSQCFDSRQCVILVVGSAVHLYLYWYRVCRETCVEGRGSSPAPRVDRRRSKRSSQNDSTRWSVTNSCQQVCSRKCCHGSSFTTAHPKTPPSKIWSLKSIYILRIALQVGFSLLMTPLEDVLAFGVLGNISGCICSWSDNDVSNFHCCWHHLRRVATTAVRAAVLHQRAVAWTDLMTCWSLLSGGCVLFSWQSY